MSIEYNACIRMDVILIDGYTGNRQKAIDEAVLFSQKFNVPVKLVYADQIAFNITPEITESDIKNMKNRRIVIGV